LRTETTGTGGAGLRIKAPFGPFRDSAEGEFRLALDEKEKGYLTHQEVNELVPRDVLSPEDLEDVLTTIGTQGIDVLGGQPKLPSAALRGTSA
jgi:hypothetical protein